jgi:hypothetical protein
MSNDPAGSLLEAQERAARPWSLLEAQHAEIVRLLRVEVAAKALVKARAGCRPPDEPWAPEWTGLCQALWPGEGEG